MAQLDLVPARVDSDYLLLQSLDAILAEAQSIRYSEIDGAGAKAQAAEAHRELEARHTTGSIVLVP